MSTPELVIIARLRELIDKARRFTASDPDNEYCRQATLLLDLAMKESL